MSREVIGVFDRVFDCSEFFLGDYDLFCPSRTKKYDGIFDVLFRKAESWFGHLAEYSDVTSRVTI